LWDADHDDSQELIEHPPRDTDSLPAEIPGVFVESDFAPTDAVVPDTDPTDDTQAAAALANANLDTPAQSAEIAGVDYDAVDLTDEHSVPDEEVDDDDEATIKEEVDTEQEQLIIPEEIDTEQEQLIIPEETDTTNAVAAGVEPAEGEESDEDSDEDEESVTSVQAVRRSGRRRRIRPPLVVDFDNLAYARGEDGVVHINPSVLEQAKEDLKITSDDLFSEPMGDTKRAKMSFRCPATAGITRNALQSINMAGVHMPAPKLGPNEHLLVEDHMVMHVLGVVLAQQYSVNKGIQLFGDKARESVRKELQQLHDYETYTPVYAHELTADQKKQALASLIFITEKRCGRIKSRACVNGSKQRDYIPKETTASPTVMNDSVMIQSAIDAHEGRKVVTCDIPGAFLHADLDEEVVMLLRGQLAELMVQVDPERYAPYLIKSVCEDAKGDVRAAPERPAFLPQTGD
jgi:hypothetical protein